MQKYEQQAEELFAALQAGNEDAQWRVKWEHPCFRGKSIEDVRADPLDLDDARMVVAQQQSFNSWEELRAFVNDQSVAEFEEAVEAVVGGDAEKLRTLLQANPELVRARSTRRHHSTLLHYIGANGVEGQRQKTPKNAVEITKLLLDAGADPDAVADLYDHQCTTMSMLVSSSHPHEAGLQVALAETLLDYGASLDGVGTNWESAVLTALQFGYLDTARALAARGVRLDFIMYAGLGDRDAVARLLPDADADSRQKALALAAQHGHADVVRLLVDAGADPNGYNPEGYHSHTTPLHQAVWANHMEVVRLLVERGARLDQKDTLYSGTPLAWAIYGKRDEIAAYLRELV